MTTHPDIPEMPPDAHAEGSTRSAFLRRAAVAGAGATAIGGLAGVGVAGASPPKGDKGDRARDASLHDRLNRTSHWDLNVADLAKARAWYEGTTSLRVVAETSASQDFPSLGIKGGRFEGLMLRDADEAYDAPMLHLVEWKNPLPVGVANASYGHVGFNRMVQLVPDLDVTRAAVIAQGTQPILANSDFIRPPLHPSFPPQRYTAFTAPDHEGVFNQFFSTGSYRSLTFMNFNTADLDFSLPFFLEVLGLDFSTGVGQPPPGSPNVYGGDGSNSTFDGVFMLARGNTRVNHDFLQWDVSASLPTPYEEPTHRGIVRCAFQVDDIDRCYRELQKNPWTRKRRFTFSRPEEWDYGSAFGTRQVIEMTNFEGVRFQLIEQPPYPFAQLHPFGYDPPGRKGR
jgi:catechol 2,3-dioxygenase-like lactoylglutathione lyase family enzyme